MLKVYINFAMQADSHNAFWRKTHQLTKGRRHLLFFLKVVLSEFSQRNTRRTSAPFRAGQILNPYPSHYRTAFASSCILLPHLPQCALRFHLPIDKLWAEIRGSHVPHNCQFVSDLGLPATPAALHPRKGSYETLNLAAIPFGPSLSASLTCSP